VVAAAVLALTAPRPAAYLAAMSLDRLVVWLIAAVSVAAGSFLAESAVYFAVAEVLGNTATATTPAPG
jgi:hypothetical protein